MTFATIRAAGDVLARRRQPERTFARVAPNVAQRDVAGTLAPLLAPLHAQPAVANVADATTAWLAAYEHATCELVALEAGWKHLPGTERFYAVRELRIAAARAAVTTSELLAVLLRDRDVDAWAPLIIGGVLAVLPRASHHVVVECPVRTPVSFRDVTTDVVRAILNEDHGRTESILVDHLPIMLGWCWELTVHTRHETAALPEPLRCRARAWLDGDDADGR